MLQSRLRPHDINSSMWICFEEISFRTSLTLNSPDCCVPVICLLGCHNPFLITHIKSLPSSSNLPLDTFLSPNINTKCFTWFFLKKKSILRGSWNCVIVKATLPLESVRVWPLSLFFSIQMCAFYMREDFVSPTRLYNFFANQQVIKVEGKFTLICQPFPYFSFFFE